MNVRSFFLPPYTRRRLGAFFIVVGIAGLVVSTVSVTNYRGDWLDPRWWARGFAVVLLIGGIVAVTLPHRVR